MKPDVPALFLFRPLFQLRPWGGRALSEILGKEGLPEGPVGESWEVVDRPEAQSLVVGGPCDGQPLGDILKKFSGPIMGPKWNPRRPFPLLVKWLDCRERLSLQVHPSTAACASLKGEPKTENWYLAHATSDAAVLVGLAPGTSREIFAKALETNDVEKLVHRHPVRAGDSLFVPSGHLHAIDAGCLILEIQQNSDTTYRVYDWDRVGLDGKPRQLHIRESLISINFRDPSPGLIRSAGLAGETLLAESHVFRLRKVTLNAGEAWSHRTGHGPALLGVVRGGLMADEGTALAFGANALLTHARSVTFAAGSDGAEVLVTDRFA